MRIHQPLIILAVLGLATHGRCGPVPVVKYVERQPLAAQTRRVAEALNAAGAPLPAETVRRLSAAKTSVEIQDVLDPFCLAVVRIPRDGMFAEEGPAAPRLIQDGWTAFLVKVINPLGRTGPLSITSPEGGPVFSGLDQFYALKGETGEALTQGQSDARWTELAFLDTRPMMPDLSGLVVEYRILQIYSKVEGARHAALTFTLGPDSTAPLHVGFESTASTEVRLGVQDTDGSPTTAGFVITDLQGRVHPYCGKRLAPDFFFHDQIYRADGEVVRLPPGPYTIRVTRGPEYLVQEHTVTIPATPSHRIDFRLERWIHPNARGWFSGDHHIHAAGCLHYKTPTMGVDPPVIMRNLRGEGLNIGCVLNWGPGWDHQRQFFSGRIHELSGGGQFMRYDVETSGFPCSHMGHLALLGLKEDAYRSPEGSPEWPSWNGPMIDWARRQGAVIGVAHSGWGLDVYPESRIPNLVIPPMNGIGAQEYLVDVALGGIDFISAINSPSVWELNIWYHTLNCGFPVSISGETDFPCMLGDRIGVGRTYVRLKGPLDFEGWLKGLKAGRSYVSDGRSHLFDFKVDDAGPGEGRNGELRLKKPRRARFSLTAAALLPEAPERVIDRGIRPRPLQGPELEGAESVTIQSLPYNKVPYWHVERARIGVSRRVGVEVVVNAEPVWRGEIEADGSPHELAGEIDLTTSCWIAARILPSSHTSPLYVKIADKPIRASAASAQWCLDAIDVLWREKSPMIREGAERDAALEAFEKARAVYRKILSESPEAAPSPTP